VFGQSAAQTGSGAGLGLDMREGLLRALRQTPSVRGRRIVLLSYDDKYTPSVAVEVTDRLLNEDNVFALLGSMGSATSAAVLPAVEEHKVPLIGPLTGARLFRFPTFRYVINVRAAYDDETAAMVNHLSELGFSKVGLFRQNDTYGQAGKDGLEMALGRRGISIVTEGTYERNSFDVISDGIAVMNQTDPPPEAIVVFTVAAQAVSFLREAIQQFPDTLFYLPSPVQPSVILP